MMQRTPETPREQEPIDLKKDADSMRTALGITDAEATLDKWVSLLQTLTVSIADPEQSKQPESVKVQLRSMHVSLSATGQPDSLHTKAVEALADAKNAQGKLPEVEIRRIKRALSLYYETRFQYEALWAGKVSSGRSVPPYLAEFIKLRDNEKFAYRVVESLLPMQYDVMKDAGYDPIKNKEDKPWFRNADRASQLALFAMGNQLSFERVLNCLNKDGSLKTEKKPYVDFLIASGVKESEVNDDAIRSAKLLIGFLKKYRYKVQTMAKFQGVEEKDLSINQAIEATADTAIVGRFASKIVNAVDGFNPWLGDKIPDLGDFAKQVFDDAENYPERARHLALLPLIELVEEKAKKAGKKPRTPEEVQKDASEVAKFLLGKEASDVTLKNIARLSGHLSEAQMEIISELSAYISSKESQDKVLSALFIDPSADLNPRDKEVADALKELMENKEMKSKEAFELYYLLQGENTVAVAYMAVRLLSRHNYKILSFRMKVHVFEEYSSLATSEVEDIDELAKKLNLTDRQKVELRNLRLYLKDHGVDVVYQVWDKYWAMWKDHPWWMSLFHTPVAIGGTKLVLSVYNRIRWDTITRFCDAKTDADLDSWIEKNSGKKPTDQLRKEARAMQKQASDILDMKIRLGHRSAILRVLGMQMPQSGEILRPRSLRVAATEIVRAATSGELSEIARTLRNTKHLDGNIKSVIEIMAPLGTPAQLAEALHDAGYEPDAIKQSITLNVTAVGLAARTVGNVDTTLGKGWADVKAVELELKVLDGRSRKPRPKGGGRRG